MTEHLSQYELERLQRIAHNRSRLPAQQAIDAVATRPPRPASKTKDHCRRPRQQQQPRAVATRASTVPQRQRSANMQAFLAKAFENRSLPATLFAELETALEKQRITAQDMQVYDKDAWSDLWEGLAKDGVYLNPGDKQSLRLAAGPSAGMLTARNGVLASVLSSQSAASHITQRQSVYALYVNMFVQVCHLNNSFYSHQPQLVHPHTMLLTYMTQIPTLTTNIMFTLDLSARVYPRRALGMSW